MPTSESAGSWEGAVAGPRYDGARGKEREAYANDLGDDRALVAVTARSNRSKADQDPATWLPPAEAYRCEYLADWVAVKVRWQLAVDDVERQALTDGMANCPNEPVKVTLAR
ncbi:GmrSD restriction endonuclease domain-containing protein [Streptomyces coeruleorubidus]|uniref:GmrSD restriction endonuclease domain-containing protein n=1 Tax=Streptomyces coeruleorubidus TaxID=116188 RepID=UPI00387E2AD3